MCAPWARPAARRCYLRRRRPPRASRGSEQGPWQGRLQSAHDPAQMPPPALRFCVTSLLSQSSELANRLEWLAWNTAKAGTADT